jgi:mRNA interferase MazF
LGAGRGRHMRRGEIWTISETLDYARKPRPAVIVQDDGFEELESVTVCTFTTAGADSPLVRPLVQPSETNGLIAPSHLMVDKITTIRKSRLGYLVGKLDTADIVMLNQAVLVFLGLARRVDA